MKEFIESHRKMIKKISFCPFNSILFKEWQWSYLRSFGYMRRVYLKGIQEPQTYILLTSISHLTFSRSPYTCWKQDFNREKKSVLKEISFLVPYPILFTTDTCPKAGAQYIVLISHCVWKFWGLATSAFRRCYRWDYFSFSFYIYIAYHHDIKQLATHKQFL